MNFRTYATAIAATYLLGCSSSTEQTQETSNPVAPHEEAPSQEYRLPWSPGANDLEQTKGLKGFVDSLYASLGVNIVVNIVDSNGRPRMLEAMIGKGDIEDTRIINIHDPNLGPILP